MYNVRDYGAVPSTSALSTQAIQSAIDECHANGGGRVVIPAGTYTVGSIFLRSHVELHLEHGARLVASRDLADYNADDAYEQNYGCDAEYWRAKHLIIAAECDDVALTGGGSIDGSGDFFFEEPHFYPYHKWMTGYGFRHGIAFARDKVAMRPGQTVCFVECTNVTVKDVTLCNCPCWALFLHGCEQVSVTGVKIFNPPYFGNTDGIDIDCCRYVTVSDCMIETGDDAITFRCSEQRLKNKKPCEFVTVTNCTLSSGACAFRIGVGYGRIRHIRVSNIVIKSAGYAINYMTTYSAMGCATIEDVNFSGISAYDVGFPITLGCERGSIRHITLENMRFYSLAGIKARAAGEGEISDLCLRRIDLHLLPDPLPLDERRHAVRGDSIFSLQGVTDATLTDLRVHAAPELLESWESALAHRDCTDVKVRDCILP
ncbi:MAG: hypothetical protein IJW29_04320 [Clostridia bacterium]|nr:hypothetical protein [Clostridia bacterium]